MFNDQNKIWIRDEIVRDRDRKNGRVCGSAGESVWRGVWDEGQVAVECSVDVWDEHRR